MHATSSVINCGFKSDSFCACVCVIELQRSFVNIQYSFHMRAMNVAPLALWNICSCALKRNTATTQAYFSLQYCQKCLVKAARTINRCLNYQNTAAPNVKCRIVIEGFHMPVRMCGKNFLRSLSFRRFNLNSGVSRTIELASSKCIYPLTN